MKKILIIGSGDVLRRFIDKISQSYTSDNIYYIVESSASNYEHINQSRFKFFEFDPTSHYKLANILKMDFFQVMIMLDRPDDIEHTIKNIRLEKKHLRIVVLSEFELHQDDPNIIAVNSNDLLSYRMLDFLPNIPVVAQNVGLGEGEIMEVMVPFGSSFIYRHISAIEQREWRIAAIYRNQELVLPYQTRMIHPNDVLLLIGDPKILKSVYMGIKKELGQFPEPYGTNLYLFIDMLADNLLLLDELIDKAKYLRGKFKKKLYVRVVNPTDLAVIQEIKKHASLDVQVEICYDDVAFNELIRSDIKSFFIGLIVVSKEIFCHKGCRELFYEFKIPLLKLSNKDVEGLKDGVIVLSDSRDIEKISSSIFDISQQLEYNLELYNYLNEHQEVKEQMIEHFTNLATNFTKKIHVENSEKNPIKELSKRDNFMQILPFTKHITRKRSLSMLSTNSDKLFFKLDDFHQLFIPI